VSVEYRWQHADGRYRWFLEKGVLIRDEKGAPREIIGTWLDITERKQAEQQLLESREKLRALAVELSTAEDRERRRIATYLHDRIGQDLAVLRMKLGAMQAASDEEEASELNREIRDLLEHAIEETSSLTFELSPPILYELGLEAALEWIGEKLCHEHDLLFELSDDGRPKPLGEDVAPLLFRSTRELLFNVIKHAGASRVTIAMSCEETMACILVEDDGVGFDTSKIAESAKAGGFGLLSIRERTRFIGGELVVESTPGRGTRALLRAPLRLGDESDAR
jgi:signal transduction histidine kinase